MRTDREQLITSPPFPLRQDVYGRLIEQPDGHIALAIIIDEHTVVNNIGQAAPAIDRVQTLLTRFQGTTTDAPHNALLERYVQLHAEGWSFYMLAMDINYACLVQLCHAAEELPRLDIPATGSEGLLHAFLLLKSMGLPDTVMAETLLPAMATIQRGQASWSLEQGPVTWMKVREAIRYRNQSETASTGESMAPPQRRSVFAATLAALERPQQRHCAQAQALLQHTYPQSFDKYTKRLWQLLQGTHQTSENEE